MIITIFGSCRQDSLYNYYDITSIREQLTYPHYSKEAVQAVQFCKGDISSSNTQHLFRSGILKQQPIKSEEFLNEYNATDLFVVEIASRAYYKYKGQYVHHILTEPRYRFHDISNIEVGRLSDSDIEADLLALKRLFYPKPFVIVTHIYTRTHGTRYELVELLKRLCLKHNIYILDPVVATKDFNSNLLYEKEDVISHYTRYGHSIIGEKYREFIDGVWSDYRRHKNLMIM